MDCCCGFLRNSEILKVTETCCCLASYFCAEERKQVLPNLLRQFFVALVMCEPAIFVKTTHILGVLFRVTEEDIFCFKDAYLNVF
jgi:hypothetical protein